MRVLFILFFLILPVQLLAQDFSTLRKDVEVKLSPEIPSPREMVTATAISGDYSDLKKEMIVWHINDVERKRGLGETTFQFQAPPAGVPMEIFVTIEKPNRSIANFVNLQTATVDLIYEANTYTPPFYKGTSIFTPQSTITVYALTDLLENGAKINKKDIVYRWYKNEMYLSSMSGAGKDSAVFYSEILTRPFNVRVVAESVNSDLKAEKSIYVKPKSPQVVLYENNPLFGNIFEKALTGTFNFDREAVGITAVPYYFNIDEINSGNLKYSWYENGKRIDDETFGGYINYLNPNREKSGFSKLGVKVEHNDSYLQYGENFFNVNVLGNQQSDTIKTNETSVF